MGHASFCCNLILKSLSRASVRSDCSDFVRDGGPGNKSFLSLEIFTFAYRFNSERPVSLHEMLNPLSEEDDSVAPRADVELGGRTRNSPSFPPTFNHLSGIRY
jgi:hypothetical protein